MSELRQFIKNEVRSFVREQRVRAKLSPNVRFNGYLLGQLEERAEQVPLCDLYPILKFLDDGRLAHWWLDFQKRTAEIKRKQN